MLSTKIVQEYRNHLNSFESRFNTKKLLCVPSHSNVEGNAILDALTKERSVFSMSESKTAIAMPVALANSDVVKYICKIKKNATESHPLLFEVYGTSRGLIVVISKRKIKDVLDNR